ncbi:GvpL/GvpF family gas vesicle protein [uncultured Streptomyces sp.]|uniref:GvpL/GvpF family gas vesicle protein n=1 Tax=uncultured Streptomyces sp. TaxID=174707 RepID=UPI00261BCB3F|nr:GvpL/GvpF family gas vesicle protein [uncultured Streptomyces sp.]
MTEHGVYVYGIVGRGTAVPEGMACVGGAGSPARTVGAGKVRAVVSDAPASLRARRRDLLAHQELLMRLAENGPVLPMRFGMVATDERAVSERLAADERACLTTLKELADRVEVNVKAFPAQDSLASLLADDARIRRLREEVRRRPGYEASVRLGEAVATALARRATEAGRDIARELAGLARSTVPGPEVHGCVLNASFLVDRDVLPEFLDTARRHAGARGEHVDLRIAGPLPCYSFVADIASSPAPTPAMVGRPSWD